MIRPAADDERSPTASSVAPRPAGDDRARWFTWALGALLVALMGWALPRHVQAGDAGEFATVMLEGGLPHPSGYPWMRLLGLPSRLLHAMGVPPMLAAALPPATAGAAAWGLVHRLGAPTARAGAAALTTALVASSPLCVIHVNDCEVWGPLLLFVAGLTWLAWCRPHTHPALLGLLLGAAVSHHLTAILMLPLAVGAAWPRHGGWKAVLRAGGWGVAGSVVGLGIFLTLFVGDGDAWRWGDVSTAQGWLHHVTRGDYGTTSLSLHAEKPPVVDLWTRSWGSIVASCTGADLPGWSAGLLLLALAALAPRPAEVRRSTWRGFLGCLVLSTLVFPAMGNIDPSSPFGAWILERFDLLPSLLWSVMLALALSRGLEWAERRRSAPFPPVVLALVATAWLSGQLARTATAEPPSAEAAVEAYARDLLATPAPDGPMAVVVGTDDHRTFPVLYAQEVLGDGAGVLYIDAQLLYHPWYRAALRRKMPQLPDVDKPVRLLGAIMADPELAEHPLYLANAFSRPAMSLPVVPEGVLLRVVSPRASPEDFSPAQITERHLAALDRYVARAADFAGLRSAVHHPWSADLWHAYTEPSRQLADALARDGDLESLSILRDRMQRIAGDAALPVTSP